MYNLRVGDIVGRKSYGNDILFKVVDIVGKGTDRKIILKGITYRLEADAPESDIVILPKEKVESYRSADRRAVEECRHCLMKSSKQRAFSPKGFLRGTSRDNPEKYFIPGTILHIDGDEDYLHNCLNEYNSMNLKAYGQRIPEKEQASQVRKYLEQYRPDILVLTGHDGLIKGAKDYSDVNNYRNSKYFIEAVKEARRYCPYKDQLVIFAGACQSYYEGIIEAGANFASAPARVPIHALDPVFICQKIAQCRVDQSISAVDAVEATITGVKGIGGIQTMGKMREAYPKRLDEN